MHRVRDHKRKAKLDFRLPLFPFCSLFTVFVNGNALALWTLSSISLYLKLHLAVETLIFSLYF
jgi:hypothetical protein